jgi:exodeoxyribonuclease V beta subunit
VVWWAGSWDSRNSPLGRLIAGRADDGTVAPDCDQVPTDDDVETWFRATEKQAPGMISVTGTDVTGTPRRWRGGAGRPANLDRRHLGRSLDGDWHRTSYSAITAAAHTDGRDRTHEPEPDQREVTDEAMPDTPAGGPSAPGVAGEGADAGERDDTTGETVPLGTMPGGTAVGSLVHAVLEVVDFTAADLDTELADRLAVEVDRSRVDLGDHQSVVAGLRLAIETPLGPVAGGIALRSVPRRDRLDELDFELPLTGGDDPRDVELTVAAIGDLLRARIPTGDALDGYADLLGAPELQRTLRGYLTGSIDAVLRVGDRFVVVDYKTNRLAPAGEVLRAEHHRPAALVAAMCRAHYPLQALLYAVALHRYLRWRLPGYDPGRHLGGILYLFLRGMTGPEVVHTDGQPDGVFSWVPPPGLVPALSDLLDRGPTP